MATVSYATTTDFTGRFGEAEVLQLTDLANTGASDEVLLLLALQDAADEINTYISRAYKLPLPAAADKAPIVRVSCDIARYRLYKDRPTDEVTARYKQSMSWLKDLSTGIAVIVFDPPLTVDQETKTQVPLVVGAAYSGGAFGSAFDGIVGPEDVSWRG